MEISNLAALREQPEALYLTGVPSELPVWSSGEDQKAYLRARIEATALAGMTHDELHVYFARHRVEAMQSWNRHQTFFGRLLNRLTVSRRGYVRISARVLRQFYDAFGVQADESFMASAEVYLRADIVAEIATLTQSKGADR